MPEPNSGMESTRVFKGLAQTLKKPIRCKIGWMGLQH